MKTLRFFSIFLIFSILLSLFTLPAAADDFHADAKAALLVEETTGEILYAQNIHKELYPASLTKVMVALLVMEKIDAGKMKLTDTLTASREAIKENGSTTVLLEGEELTVKDLLYAMLVPSANQAASILAEGVDGSIEDFVKHMNERAKELGCQNTHFANPIGLHDEDHYSSAWDLYLITKEARTHDLFLEICKTAVYEVPATNLSEGRRLHTTNSLLSNWKWIGYMYKYADGVKTGSTDEAGQCLIASAKNGSRKLISVILGADRVTKPDGKTDVKNFSETIRMFEWGFSNFRRKKVISTEEAICEVPVALSKETNYVIAHPAKDLESTLPNDLDPATLKREVKLDAESANAPIAAGDKLGTITLSNGDTTYGTVDLVALNAVSASRFLRMQYDLKLFFRNKIVKLILILLLIGVAILFAIAFSPRNRRRGKRSPVRRRGYRGRGRRF